MLEIKERALPGNKPEEVRQLYDRHGAALLGYLFAVLNNRQLAEEYLVQLFTELSTACDGNNWSGNTSWFEVQKYAQAMLAKFKAAANDCEPAKKTVQTVFTAAHSYTSQLTAEQKLIFCEVYYHGRMVADLSIQLNKTEDLIRKTLKEAFAIIRKSGEN